MHQPASFPQRSPHSLYPVIFVDGLRVAVRTDKGVLKKCVYTVLGSSVSGRQEVLGLWVEETEGAAGWRYEYDRSLPNYTVLLQEGLGPVESE